MADTSEINRNSEAPTGRNAVPLVPRIKSVVWRTGHRRNVSSRQALRRSRPRIAA
jgi:hypothetical protein